MGGLFGIGQVDGQLLAAPDVSALADASSTHDTRVATGPSTAIFAGGWATYYQGGDGICVAGAAHLVDGPGLAAEAMSRHPLESVAAVYRAHGPQGLGRLRGQFCLAIHDEPANRLVLMTDRFTTWPIYYAERPGGVIFGSRLSGLPARLRARIEPQAILEYMLYTVVPSPRTPYVGVRKLPPAHVLIAERSGISVVPYWDMSYPEARNGKAEDWAHQLRAEIEKAVRRSVAAEDSSAEIGAFLSGGTDSSTIAGMITSITRQPVRTFSIGYTEAGYDELEYAHAASSWFGTKQHQHLLEPAEAFAALAQIVAYYEEPFGNASALPTYSCARLARENGVQVLFAGDGGDELFAGNERYRTHKIFSLYQRIPKPLRTRLTDPLLLSLPDGLPLLGQARRYVRRSNIPNPRRFYSYDLMLSASLENLLAPAFLDAVEPDHLLATAEAHFNRPASPTTELNRMMYLDLKLAIADNDVRKVSGMAELAGIEVRYPFLDAELAEFSGRIPSDLKLHGLQKRYIFKRALADFLPPKVLNKPKHGFGAPIAVWMKHDARWRELVADLLHDRRTRERGYFLPSVLDALWSQHQGEQSSYYGDLMWPVLMLELWHREHVDA